MIEISSQVLAINLLRCIVVVVVLFLIFEKRSVSKRQYHFDRDILYGQFLGSDTKDIQDLHTKYVAEATRSSTQSYTHPVRISYFVLESMDCNPTRETLERSLLRTKLNSKKHANQTFVRDKEMNELAEKFSKR